MERSFEPELMDDTSVSKELVDEALSELKLINKYLGGNSVSQKGIELLKDKTVKENLKVLDLGAGSSDNLLMFKEKFQMNIFPVDLNMNICRVLKEEFPNTINCNALVLPLKQNSFDAAHASLFFHHFNEDEIVKMLKQLKDVTRDAIVINDLRRSVLALTGIKILTSLFSKSKLVKYDAPLSVKRGFKKNELIKLLKGSGLNNFMIKRKWAFRWLVIIYL